MKNLTRDVNNFVYFLPVYTAEMLHGSQNQIVQTLAFKGKGNKCLALTMIVSKSDASFMHQGS